MPDDIQLEHYYLLKSAIDDKNKINAFMALDLLEGDVSRWYADKSIEATAITDLETLTEAVEKEKWDAARKILDDLVAKYRPKAE